MNKEVLHTALQNAEGVKFSYIITESTEKSLLGKLLTNKGGVYNCYVSRKDGKVNKMLNRTKTDLPEEYLSLALVDQQKTEEAIKGVYGDAQISVEPFDARLGIKGVRALIQSLQKQGFSVYTTEMELSLGTL